MRILVVGNFSGTSSAPRHPLAERPTWKVDIDNLDHVLARAAPHITAAGAAVGFNSLEDFHPDRLYATLDLFRTLREARAASPTTGADLLAGLLGKPGKDSRPTAAPPSGLDALIREIVAPYVVPDTKQTASAYLAAVDAATTEQMRRLLQAPAFQALEATWRGVGWLVSNLELDETLELHLFDARCDELLADVVAVQGQLAETGLHRALVDRYRNVPGGEGWSLVVGLYRFGASDTDIGLLAVLGLIAAQAGGPFIAEADPVLAGTNQAALRGWRELRGSEAAPWIGLAAPRLLLRLPYGRRRDPIDAFAFEESEVVPEHESLLWGNPALAVALLIGRAFQARGWDFEPGDEREIGDLPALSFERDGEQMLQPCAEWLLREQTIDAMMAAGLMPLASHKDRNLVTLVRFQSISEPAGPLAGLGAAAR